MKFIYNTQKRESSVKEIIVLKIGGICMKRFLVIVLLSGIMIFNLYGIGVSLSKDMLEEITEYKLTKKDELVQDTLYGTSLWKMAVNPDVFRKHNERFTHEIETGNITNQKYTGSCWIFGALNSLRPFVVKKTDKKDFEFSQNYIYFYSKLEKANFFFEKVIDFIDYGVRSYQFQELLDEPISDGGYYSWVRALIKKYGIIPDNQMIDTKSTKNSYGMNKILNRYVLISASKMIDKYKKTNDKDDMREMKKKFLKGVYKILVLHLGTPPDNFTFAYKEKKKDEANNKKKVEDKNNKKQNTKDKKDKNNKEDKKEWIEEKHTPKSFAKKYVYEDMDKIVTLTYIPSRKMNQPYKIEGTDLVKNEMSNIIRYNMNLKEIKKMMKKSIKDDLPVAFAANANFDMHNDTGVMHPDVYNFEKIYDLDLKRNKAAEGLMGLIFSNHLMTILGLDEKNGEVIKWKVENSWGKDAGDKGIYYMYDSWINKYVEEVYIHRKYLSKKHLKNLKKKPIEIEYFETPY